MQNRYFRPQVLKLALISFVGTSDLVVAESNAYCAQMSATGAFVPDGRPATMSDLAGKKFCWNVGHFSMFMANGNYTNDSHAALVWSIVKPGLLKVGKHYYNSYILPDGKLHQHNGAIWDRWGTVCN